MLGARMDIIMGRIVNCPTYVSMLCSDKYSPEYLADFVESCAEVENEKSVPNKWKELFEKCLSEIDISDL